MLFREEDKDMDELPFMDRHEAGCALARKVSGYSDRADVIVLGLPRGGVPVAFALAGKLHLPLDVLVVNKIGTPWNRELAMGAVAEGDVQVLDRSMVRQLDLSEERIREVTAVAQEDLERLQQFYRAGRTPLQLAGKTVVLVDDGIATGCSMLAAIASVRRRKAARVVVAVPVIPASGCSAVRMEADEVISVAEPELFFAVSQWYRDFNQISDAEVQSLLESAKSWLLPAA